MENNNILLLENISSQKIFLFFHQIIDDLCGINGPQEDHYVPNVWPNRDQFLAVCEASKQLLINAIDMRYKNESLNQLPENIRKNVFECLEVRRANMKAAIMKNTINYNHHVLKDFFWKLNVVLASDKMANINDPLLNLELCLSEPKINGESNRILSIELNKEELNEVLKTLEEAQQTLMQHS